MAYLKLNRRGGHVFWAVVNTIAAEGLPECRWQLRDNTRAALAAMMALIRERKVLRYKRRWVAIIDVPTMIEPLEETSRGWAVAKHRS